MFVAMSHEPLATIIHTAKAQAYSNVLLIIVYIIVILPNRSLGARQGMNSVMLEGGTYVYQRFVALETRRKGLVSKLPDS